MSARLLLRLAAVLAALLLVWGAVALAGRGTAAGMPAARLLGVDTAATDSIVIARAGDTVLLARAEGRWRVNGHPAAADQVAALLSALADTSALELAAESESSHRRLGVDADSGRRLRAVGGKELAVVVGKGAGFGTGYVRRSDAATVYRVRGRLPELATQPADEWRDKTVATVPADSIATIEVRRGRERYVLRREGTRWLFGTGVAADSGRAAELAQALGEVRAAGFATSAQAKALRFALPDRRLTLKGSDGRVLAALVFDSTAGGSWVRHDSGGTVWRMESWDVDRLTPAASSLR